MDILEKLQQERKDAERIYLKAKKRIEKLDDAINSLSNLLEDGEYVPEYKPSEISGSNAKGERKWKEYLLDVLLKFNKDVVFKELFDYVLKNNPDLVRTEKATENLMRQVLWKMAEKNMIASYKSPNDGRVVLYQLKKASQ